MKYLQAPVIIEIAEEYQIHKARRMAREIADKIGFDLVGSFSIVTSISELSYNLCFHTNTGGIIKIAAVQNVTKTGIEIISEDNGPGISDLSLAMQDGFSTNGGLGSGLPGVKRLMDEFEIFSEVGIGTWILARKWKTRKLP